MKFNLKQIGLIKLRQETIKTKTYLHELIWQLAAEGTAVLLISSDMAEMIVLADRILVMNDFRLVGEVGNSRDYDQMSHAIMACIHDHEEHQENSGTTHFTKEVHSL